MQSFEDGLSLRCPSFPPVLPPVQAIIDLHSQGVKEGRCLKVPFCERFLHKNLN